MDFRARYRRLKSVLTANHLDALLITHLPNVRYLCGFTGSAGSLVVTEDASLFFTDGRYTAQAKDEVKNAKVRIGDKAALAGAADWLEANGRALGGRRIGIEADHITFADYARLKKTLGAQFRLRATSSLVEQFRMVKDSEEIESLRRAVLLGCGLFDKAVETIRAGVKETEVAAEMEYAARQQGADGMSFETIIASGPRSALPHGRASSAAVPSQGFVVCDFGVILAGYCSDMTRTVFVGRPSANERGIYDAVRVAQEAAIAAVQPGASVGEVDRAARNVLKSKGLARYFTHSTGHGVGLEIHEPPRIAAGQQQLLQPGMVITIEPGAYLPGRGGVRIEDMVVVTEAGCEVLTPTPKDLVTI